MSNQIASPTARFPEILDVAPLIAAATFLWSSGLITKYENSFFPFLMSVLALLTSQSLALIIMGCSVPTAIRNGFLGSSLVLVGVLGIVSPVSPLHFAWIAFLVSFISLRLLRRRRDSSSPGTNPEITYSYCAIIAVLLCAIWAGSPSV